MSGMGISIISTSRGVHDRQAMPSQSTSAASCCVRFGDGLPQHTDSRERAQSRVGKRPMPLPKGVEVKVDGRKVTVKGPKGTLARELPAERRRQDRRQELVIVLPRRGAGATASSSRA